MEQQILLQQSRQDYIDLIQLTDTHILSEKGETFDAIDTMLSLQQVIKYAQANIWPPDAVLLTGDLVHNPERKAYKRLAEILQTMDVRVFCIPGNHDDPELMRKVMLQDNIYAEKVLQFQQWTVLMLNTYQANTHAGYLHNDELEFLKEQLNEHVDKYVLICLHHPPVSIGSPWMDKMSLKNSDDLFSIIDQYHNIKGILWGHIHQEFNGVYNNIQLMATPSTCVQFTPGTSVYLKDNKPPGYRRLKLYNSGEIKTEIIRVPHRNCIPV